MQDKTTNPSAEDKKFDVDEIMLSFAAAQKQILQKLEGNNGRQRTNSSYAKYSQADIIGYLQNPVQNQARLIEVSNYFYNNSSHYRRLIDYYALLPTYAYTLAPGKYNGLKSNVSNLGKQFYKVAAEVEKMNLKHELAKAMRVTLREGVAYGVIWSNSDSWHIQYLPHNYCMLRAIEDGVWQFAFDCSMLSEDTLELYPPEFKKLYNAYRNGGTKYQDVPAEISFCLKADETNLNYSIPPFISVIPMLYTLENEKELYETATEIANYKLLNMQLDCDEDGVPKMDFNLAMKYYAQVAAVLPPYVGLSLSPMKIDSINFEQSNIKSEIDPIADAEEHYWSASGSSSLLFGSAKNNSAGALKLSIKADEPISFAILTQAERLINNMLLHISGTQKFKVVFLRASVFNIDEHIKTYKELSTLGVPVKTMLAAAVGLTPADVAGMATLENDVLKIQDIFIPLDSSYNTSGAGNSSSPGRTQLPEEDLTESGTQTREAGTNDNR